MPQAQRQRAQLEARVSAQQLERERYQVQRQPDDPVQEQPCSRQLRQGEPQVPELELEQQQEPEQAPLNARAHSRE